MPGPVLTAGSTLICAHGGVASSPAPSARVRAGGVPVLQQLPLIVTGCANPPPPVNVGPCVSAQFVTSALRVRAAGLPLLLTGGVAVCSPTGSPLTTVPNQSRVTAT